VIFLRISRRLTAGPTADSRRWGFCRVLRGPNLLLATIALAVVLTGCAGSLPEECDEPGNTGFSAAEDSLGLEEFLALDPEQQQVRREMAKEWLERSRKAPRATDRVQALANAGGLTPDDPEIWLGMAKVWRWVGDNIRTEASLDNAAAAVRQLGRNGSGLNNRSYGYRRDAALRTGVLRAWLHYDRAEYSVGLSWAKAAVRLESGNEQANQVLGVLEASLGHRSQAHEIAGGINRAHGFHTDAAWILSNLDRSMGRNREAFNFFLELRPTEDHAAECFRDMGLTAERVQEWSYARRWYRESAAQLPFDDTSCLTEITHPRLDTRFRSSNQPVWLAFGRYFVTGSRSAYTALAMERFDKAASSQEKDQWAGLVVNSAGICLRMKEDVPWALRARGIVFSRTGKEDRGMEDLRRASTQLKELGLEDGRVAAEIGHLLLIKEEQTRALNSLRRAVELEADYAAAWSDLGLALIMTGDQEGAEAALSKALEIDPSSVTAWYNRGLMNLHAGHLDMAEADLLKAAELAPDNQDVARLLQQVSRRRSEGQ
jgi:tetratricopeptide (TPR) repeat protein